MSAREHGDPDGFRLISAVHVPSLDGDLRDALLTDLREWVVPDLAQAAQAFRAADQEWAGLTTLTRPSHEFLSESRRLLGVLKAVAARLNLAGTAELDHSRTLNDLVALAITTAELAAETSNLPNRLLRSHLLFGTPDRLLDPLERLNLRTAKRAAPLSASRTHPTSSRDGPRPGLPHGPPPTRWRRGTLDVGVLKSLRWASPSSESSATPDVYLSFSTGPKAPAA